MMGKSLRIALFLGLAAAPAWAGTISFQGTFSDDSNVALIHFTLNAAQLITIQSYGYAGGTIPTLPASTDILAGGFAPTAFLFDNTGNQIDSDTGGHCGTTGTDPVTGHCADPYLQQTYAAGAYTLALVEADNQPVDGILADGFKEDGTPGFTCAQFGASGDFCDVTTALGTQRNGNWAVAITGADAFPDAVPEPGMVGLLSLACFLGVLIHRRRQSN